MMRSTSLPVLCLLLLSFICQLSFTSAWSTGSGTCLAREDAITRQTGRHPVTRNLGFYLGLPLQYKAGTPLLVNINNSGRNSSTITSFNGFLIYAEDESRQRVGTWTDVDGMATTDMVNAIEAERVNSGKFACGGAEGATITHSAGGQKKIGQALTFTPSTNSTSRLTFYALVEWTGALYYSQVLDPITVCPANDDSCKAFDPATLPYGPLPVPPTTNGVQPFGLQEIDATACGGFTAVPNAVVPPGFCASYYTESGLVNRPRGIYVTDHGDLLVLESAGTSAGVSLLRDADGDGVVRKNEYTRIFTQSGLNHGLYVHGGYMYISNPNTVWRLPFNSTNPSRVIPSSEAVVVVKGIPGGGHATRTTLVSHDNHWLYVSIGSAGNLDADDSRSRVVRYDLTRPVPAGGWQWNDYTGTQGAVQAFAKGLRNEVGLILDLQGEVWGAMNADDNLDRPDLGGYTIHNDNPAERVDHLRERDMATGWYGYPYCWAADILAGHANGELFGWGGDGKEWYKGQYDDDWCRQNTIPASYALQAHTAPLGLLFYDGRGRYAFPPEYFNQIFVAEHGSWNSDAPRGYKVARIGTDTMGEALANTSRDFFAYRGPGAISNQWPHKPADVKVGPSGELFISSPDSNYILVVRYNNAPRNPVTIPRAMGAGYNYSTLGGPTKALADFSFDRAPSASSNAGFRWMEGDEVHQGLGYFDGVGMYVNTTRADNGVGVASPNVTGGTSSYEVWLMFTELPSMGGSQVVWQFSQPDSNPMMDGWIALHLDPQGHFVFSHRSGNGSAEQLTQQQGAVKAMQWWHVVVTVNQTMQSGVVVTLYTSSDAGAFTTTNTFTGIIPLMHRRSGLIGRAYRMESPTQYFHGVIDSFRMYSFALSPAQVALSYLMSAQARIEPVLQINLHMQPNEYTEATWTHVGPNNRFQPTPSSFFPGWAAFNGQQSIDLFNPGSGMGVTWGDQLRNADAFSVELWVRAQWGVQTTPFSILNAPPLLSIYHDPVNGDGALTVERDQDARVVVNGLLTPYWTQILIVCNATTGAVYMNGSLTGASVPGGSTRGAPRRAMIGEGFRGELAIMRVFERALMAEQVMALFNAQKAEEGRPELRAGWKGEVAEEEEDEAVLSLAGIIGLVVGLSAVITAIIGVLLWNAHRVKAAQKGQAAPEYGVSLLTQ